MDDAKLWDQLRRGGNVILIRHGSTLPGLGIRPGSGSTIARRSEIFRTPDVTRRGASASA
jgi:hypothetical protein